MTLSPSMNCCGPLDIMVPSWLEESAEYSLKFSCKDLAVNSAAFSITSRQNIRNLSSNDSLSSSSAKRGAARSKESSSLSRSTPAKTKSRAQGQNSAKHWRPPGRRSPPGKSTGNF